MRRFSSFLSRILIAVLLVPSGFALPAAMAAPDPAPPVVNDWVEVSTVEQLVYMDTHQDDYVARKIRLMNDIALPSDYEWIPLGGNGHANFSGIFDGQGYTVTGVKIRNESDHVGFFGAVSGSVENLGVEVDLIGGADTGGLIGVLDGGHVERSRSSGSVKGGNGLTTGTTGGLVGQAVDSTISRSYSTASVTGGSAYNVYAGGLIGAQGAGTIIESYATGSVTNLTPPSGSYIRSGAFAAWIIYGTIENSYATGEVTLSADGSYSMSSGFIGEMAADTAVLASFFDNVTTGQSTGVASNPFNRTAEVTGRSSDLMKQQSTYSNWNFTDTWTIDPNVNSGYPYLRPEILSTELPRADKDVPYSVRLTAFDGAERGLTWSASGLPAGLSLSSSGVLQGTPGESGTFSVEITAADAGSATAMTTLMLTVDGPAPDLAVLSVSPGSVLGSTKATAEPGGPDHSFAYTLTETEVLRPQMAAELPDNAVPYTLGTDIPNVNAGQYLSVYETDANGLIRAWSTVLLEASHIRSAVPPTAGTVTGTVYGVGNSRLPGVTVTVYGVAAATDSQGTFTLTDIAAGVRTLTASAPGYKTFSTTVNVIAGGSVDAGSIRLEAAEPDRDPVRNESSSPAPDPSSKMTVRINGKDVVFPIVREKESDGRSVIRLRLDAGILSSIFDSDSEEAVIDIPNTEADPIVKVDLPLAAMQGLFKSRTDAVVRIRVSRAGYALPLSLWKSAPSGTTATVAISEASPAFIGELNGDLTDQGYRMLTVPMDFSLYVDGKEWTYFGTLYTERTIVLDEAASPGVSTVVWVDSENGLHFVPAVFKTENGAAWAVFYAPHNSLYTAVQTGSAFADLKGHWARDDIETLANKLVVRGVSEKVFDPDGRVTRAEFAAMLVRALGLSDKRGEPLYSDVRSDDWYAGSVGAAREAELIFGYEDGTFRPNAPVTREQIAAMIARAIGFAGGTLPQADASALERFSDSSATAGWAWDSASRLVAAHILAGVSPADFAPRAFSTRAQSAVILKRMLTYVKFID
ncbi:S-layer homology domain-containing protein [Cohnella caldifontis]|uniref:S-layer homology domain-containing protein n=1 Tax=Cohnella caldifontis TaxID=3027471 RepID=UPI0023ED4CB3|nr:S-layer homology domain-containing protein [Cohnella sp. YIM B05605]